MKNEFPETLQEAIQHFSNEDVAFDFIRTMRWKDGVAVCPYCASQKSYALGVRGTWKCKECKKKYSVRGGTIFEDSPVPLGKWMGAFWLIVNAKNGVSSYEIGRALGVTQKTGWFMLSRIRLTMQSGSIMKMGGIVEVDETFIGGKARNMHKAEKAKRNIKTGGMSMTPVMGLLERGTREQCSRVKVEVVKTRKRPELQAHVRQYVLKGAEVHMTVAICLKCGAFKFGAFNPCDKCGALPETDDDFVLSMLLSGHYTSKDGLEKIGKHIAAGIKPEIPSEVKAQLLPGAVAARKQCQSIARDPGELL